MAPAHWRQVVRAWEEVSPRWQLGSTVWVAWMAEAAVSLWGRIRRRWHGDRRNGGYRATISNPPNKGTHGCSIRIKVGINGPDFFVVLIPLFARGEPTIDRS